MAVDIAAPSQAEIARWLVDIPPPPPRTFEVALVLGGTVSAGAYTAGAIDFLFQALDDFALAQEQGLAPRHDVTLRLIAGTSGGGVNAAIAARAAAFDYPPVTTLQTAGDNPSRNPFFDVWVNTLTLDRLLAPGGPPGKVTSLMNPEPIDAGAAAITGYSAIPRVRKWLAAPLDVIVTLTNLRGVPYAIDLGTGAQYFVDHADHARFQVRYPHQPATAARPDAFQVDFGPGAAPGWDRLGQYARATAAFPIGFPARLLERPAEHYRWRGRMVPTGAADAVVPGVRLPHWPTLQGDAPSVPDTLAFLCMDGGATDNQPIELARVAMAGLGRRNPRDGREANRAVWLIDPFAAPAALGANRPLDLARSATALLGSLVEQTRHDTSDLLLASDEAVFSRFMLSPSRVDAQGRTVQGGAALASAGLGAFIGFACRDFMRHDYLLGRANCRAFLQTQLTLHRDNPVFAGWTAAQKRALEVPGTEELPLVPLFGQAAAPAPLDPWPQGRLDPAVYRARIKARFRDVADRSLEGDLLKEVLSGLVVAVADDPVAEFAVRRMREALAAAGLA